MPLSYFMECIHDCFLYFNCIYSVVSGLWRTVSGMLRMLGYDRNEIGRMSINMILYTGEMLANTMSERSVGRHQESMVSQLHFEEACWLPTKKHGLPTPSRKGTMTPCRWGC